ncbi:MAG TPA: patatin-like phospholipase family protein, partial [Rhodocyclaceae bacterium]|nr:patatin-like phospholipase family protein [Rhodocyclaceae bacterium]
MTRPEGLSYQTANSDDALYGGADRIVAKEFEYISGWRGTEARAGVALSGGGIRSASFGLGVLQALAKGEWLQEFDYLSTVSGGGYTGA